MENNLVRNLLDSFESDNKNKKEKYKEFLAHIYITFDRRISLCRKDSIVNKYKKMRDSVIKLIIANEKQVIKELSK